MREKEASKFVWVNDDWYPSYKRNGDLPRGEKEHKMVETKGAVKLTVMKIPQQGRFKPFVRVCAWGADDTGYEMDFEGTEKEMQGKYTEWYTMFYLNIPQCVNKKWFIDQGFKHV